MVFEKYGIDMKKNRKEGNYRLYTIGVLDSNKLVVNFRRKGVQVVGGSEEVADFSKANCQECKDHSDKKDSWGPDIVEKRGSGLSMIVCREKCRYHRLCEVQGVLGNDIERIDENEKKGQKINLVLMWQMVVEGTKKK